jgi:hypothetical protein
MVGDDGRGTPLADDFDLGEARLTKEVGHCLGASVNLIATGRVRPHRGNSHQVLEVAADIGKDVSDSLDQIAHRVESTRVFPTDDWYVDPQK